MSEISNEKTNETLVEDLTTSKEATEQKNDKKKKTIIGIIIGILVLIIAFLLWFFLRRFPVTFDFNNGTEDEIVKVRYNQLIDEEDIKTKEDLGEKFIDWYEVVEEKDGVEYLAAR